MKRYDAVERYKNYTGPSWSKLCSQYPYMIKFTNDVNRTHPEWVTTLQQSSPSTIKVIGQFIMFSDDESYVMAKMMNR